MGAQTHINSAPPYPPGSLFLLCISGHFQTTGVILASRQVQPTNMGELIPPDNPQPIAPASSPADEHSGRLSLHVLEVPLAYSPN